jgi:hypothetical protein
LRDSFSSHVRQFSSYRRTSTTELTRHAERGFALLVLRWKTLQRVTMSPRRITDLARAALVLTHFERKIIP